jgi:hypothetical protein
MGSLYAISAYANLMDTDQVWYVGPIAKTIGDYGAGKIPLRSCERCELTVKREDLDIWLCMGWTVIVFPPLRAMELARSADKTG